MLITQEPSIPYKAIILAILHLIIIPITIYFFMMIFKLEFYIFDILIFKQLLALEVSSMYVIFIIVFKLVNVRKAKLGTKNRFIKSRRLVVIYNLLLVLMMSFILVLVIAVLVL